MGFPHRMGRDYEARGGPKLSIPKLHSYRSRARDIHSRGPVERQAQGRTGLTLCCPSLVTARMVALFPAVWSGSLSSSAPGCYRCLREVPTPYLTCSSTMPAEGLVPNAGSCCCRSTSLQPQTLKQGYRLLIVDGAWCADRWTALCSLFWASLCTRRGDLVCTIRLPWSYAPRIEPVQDHLRNLATGIAERAVRTLKNAWKSGLHQ